MSSSTQPPASSQPIRVTHVVLGVVLGVILTWAVQVLLTLALQAGPVVGGMPLILLLPAAVGIVLLLIPRGRQVGAGLLMGGAIGSIVGAGVCWVVLGGL